MAFKSDPNPTHSNADETGALVAAAAGAVSPVNELNAVNRAALCRTASLMHVQRNDVVKPEGAHRWLMYLVEGSLTLYSGKDEVGQISSRSPEAHQPLFADKGAYQSARTSTVARIVKFGREQLDILLREQQKNAIHVVDVEVGELDNLVFDEIVEDMKAGRARLGSDAKIAESVLAAIPNVPGIPELAELLQSDPGLAVHVVNAANRVEGASGEPTQSIRGAISRLGVEATRRSVEELLTSNVIVPGSPAVQKRLRRYVQRTTLSAAIVQVLAKGLPHMKPEAATLVALSADVGELMVLTYANRHAERFEDEARLAAVIGNLRTVLGNWLLSAWDFPDGFVDAATTARDWYRNHAGEISYTDLVTAALLIIQSEMPDAEHGSIPSADNLLLARRLQQAGIDLTSPGEIVRAATGHIMQVQSLLKAA